MSDEPRDRQAAPEVYSVLLADDSLTFRTALLRLLQRDHSLRIVGDVGDGEAVLATVARSRPDLVLMDIMMPKLDGLSAARRITLHHGIPVLLMSALARYPEQCPSLDGLPKHLVTLIDKPVLVGEDAKSHMRALIGLVKSRIQTGKASALRYDKGHGLSSPSACSLVAIAASTGGVDALHRTLRRLPRSFPPMVIAQHMDPALGTQFASQLQTAIGQRVLVVDRREPLLPNRLYVAAPQSDLTVSEGHVMSRLATAGQLAPSADRLFSSVAVAYGSTAVGIVLTGMGRDGAMGLRQLREAGGYTLAQDPASAVVDGMPRAAKDNGACCDVLTLSELSDLLAQLQPLNQGVS